MKRVFREMSNSEAENELYKIYTNLMTEIDDKIFKLIDEHVSIHAEKIRTFSSRRDEIAKIWINSPIKDRAEWLGKIILMLKELLRDINNILDPKTHSPKSLWN